MSGIVVELISITLVAKELGCAVLDCTGTAASWVLAVRTDLGTRYCAIRLDRYILSLLI